MNSLSSCFYQNAIVAAMVPLLLFCAGSVKGTGDLDYDYVFTIIAFSQDNKNANEIAMHFRYPGEMPFRNYCTKKYKLN